MVIDELFNLRSSIQEMEEILSQATKDLQRITKDEAAMYPDGEYIDGVLYVPHKVVNHVLDH